jgi:hypothetical protein
MTRRYARVGARTSGPARERHSCYPEDLATPAAHGFESVRLAAVALPVVDRPDPSGDMRANISRQVIEEETGKTVVAMMSGLPTTDGSHRHRDLIGEMFVLESADLLAEEPADEPHANG